MFRRQARADGGVEEREPRCPGLRSPGLWAGGLILVLVSALPAQPEPTSGDQQRVKLPPGRVTLDEIMAVVGGRPIFLSAVQEEFDAFVSGRESSGVLLSDQEKQQLWTQILTRAVQDRMLAHGAMTLGFATPEQVERYVQDCTRQEERDLIRQFGSIGGVVEELRYRDQTWAAYQSELRETRLKELAINESIALRLNNQVSLFVTKKALREYYKQNVQRWVHGPVATLDVVAFLPGSTNGNGNGASQEERADAASRTWNDGLSAEEVAERFGGVPVRGTWEFGSDIPDDRAPFYREFALQNSEGTVSLPIPHQGTLWVLRVRSREEGANLPFENPMVQQSIQLTLQGDLVGYLRMETLIRSQSRTYIWPAELRDR